MKNIFLYTVYLYYIVFVEIDIIDNNSWYICEKW